MWPLNNLTLRRSTWGLTRKHAGDSFKNTTKKAKANKWFAWQKYIVGSRCFSFLRRTLSIFSEGVSWRPNAHDYFIFKIRVLGRNAEFCNSYIFISSGRNLDSTGIYSLSLRLGSWWLVNWALGLYPLSFHFSHIYMYIEKSCPLARA